MTAPNADDDENFESLDALQCAGLTEHVVYRLNDPVSVRSKDSAVVSVATRQLKAERVLVYDFKENEVNAIKSLHLVNDSDLVLAPGSVSVLESGRFVGQAQFMPMLPGDDQLIPYGQDTSVSVTRRKPSARQLDDIVQVNAAKTLDCRVTLTHRKRIVTRYTVKNNSQRVVPRFYIHHTASPVSGGFTIVTTERAVKSVTGFSRFEFRLEPEMEVEFEVGEEAQFDEVLKGEAKLRELLLGRAKQLAESNVLSEETYRFMQQAQQSALRRQALTRCEAPTDLKEADIHQMRLDDQAALLPTDLLEHVQRLFHLRAQTAESKRLIVATQARERKVFQNQERLRQNIQSMEKVQSCGSLLDRYLKDLNRDEDDLQQARALIEKLAESMAKVEAETASLGLSIASSAKKLREELEAEQ
jgi:hypothetical protein